MRRGAKAVVNRFALRTQLSMNLLTHFDELKSVRQQTMSFMADFSEMQKYLYIV